MNTVNISDKFTVGDGSLTFFGGPCTAESAEVCLEAGRFLRDLCAKLGINYVFKASFDKANRSSGASRRGPGLEKGLEILAEVKRTLGVPVITDIHECYEAAAAAEVVDVLQIPAFLCRQTDLLHAAGETGRPVNIKKGQFMAPEEMKGALGKVREAGNDQVLLTERGTSFGYHNLVVDMRSLTTMRALGVPVVFDDHAGAGRSGGLRRDPLGAAAGRHGQRLGRAAGIRASAGARRRRDRDRRALRRGASAPRRSVVGRSQFAGLRTRGNRTQGSEAHP